MLLTFSRLEACPAKILPTLSTLDMSTATLYFSNSDSTFWIRAPFGAVFNVDFVKSVFYFIVAFLNFTYL